MAGSLDAAPGLKMPKPKMPGVVGKMVKAISKMPNEITKFMKITMRASKLIMESQMFMVRPDPKKMLPLRDALERELLALQMSVSAFRMNVVYISLENAGKMCNTMPITAAMAMPYVGTAVAGMCGRIGFFEAKILTLLTNAEAKISEGVILLRNINEKIMTMPNPEMLQNGGMLNSGMNGEMVQGNSMHNLPGGAMLLQNGGIQDDGMAGG